MGPISAAPSGSAGILPIPWVYLAMMGARACCRATEVAILNANYVADAPGRHYPVLYVGGDGLVAHECILDLRPITKDTGVTVDDVAKRLIDYGFHAPTMSFPVAGTLMVEPTESEDLGELDRFCDAMIAIRAEIDRLAAGEWPADDNPLVNAPHTATMLADDVGPPLPGATGRLPGAGLRVGKYLPPVRRIDGGVGDRNLVCSCPPPSELRGLSGRVRRGAAVRRRAAAPDVLRGARPACRWRPVRRLRRPRARSARAMPWPSVGEKLPLVTSPTTSSATSTA